MSPPAAIRAIVFDLLTGLLDSWTVWNAVAGDDALGMRWRAAYLRRTYAEQRYAPYLDIVAAAARDVGLPSTIADALAAQWGTLAPWPEVSAVLSALRESTPLGVVTNCSQALGERAALAVGVPFDVVVTAEAVGFYKPNPRCYLAAAEALGAAPADVLFVAGSPFDVVGAAAAGMPVYWHNRIGLSRPSGVTMPSPDGYREARDLWGLAR
ncbi:HAD-IA family hydrolase [Gemmatimonas sp.]|uniref:HAD-IA family hydrolase n=1 Tax=Gemmatimonas sp. TaxID=1962908 RepID=UPI003982F326